MLDIKKEQINESTKYDFIGSMDNTNFEKVETMLTEDMNDTYSFIFDFKHLDYISADAVKMLKRIYIMSVEFGCEVEIINLNDQTSVMLEILQVDKLYKKQEEVKNLYVRLKW